MTPAAGSPDAKARAQVRIQISDTSVATGRPRFGGALGFSMALHLGGALLLLGLAAIWREQAEPPPPFVVLSSPGANRESAVPSVVGEVEAAPDFVPAMRRRQREAEQRAEREIASAREEARQSEARREVSGPAAPRTVSPRAGRRSTSYEEFRRRSGAGSVSRVAPETGAGEDGPGRRIDLGRIPAARSGPGAGTLETEGSNDAMAGYFADLMKRLGERHEKPEGLSDLLSAEVRFTVTAQGLLTEVRITRSSGSAAFDRSVLAAFAGVTMPARPDGLTDVQRLRFRMKEP